MLSGFPSSMKAAPASTTAPPEDASINGTQPPFLPCFAFLPAASPAFFLGDSLGAVTGAFVFEGAPSGAGCGVGLAGLAGGAFASTGAGAFAGGAGAGLVD